MTATNPPDATFPALTIVDLDSFDDVESLDEITRAQLEKANRLYGGTDLTAEQILSAGEGEEERIDPEYLERGRVLDGAGHHIYDVYLYMVDSGTLFVRGSTDVVAQVIQFSADSEDRSLKQALDRALAELRKAPKLDRPKGNNPALDAYEEAVRNSAATQDKKTATKKTATKKTATKKTATKKTAAKKPAARVATGKTAKKASTTGAKKTKTAKAKKAAKPATRKPAAKKPATKKPAAKKTTARKAAPKATASARKPAARKPAAAGKKASGAKAGARKAAPKATARKPAKGGAKRKK